MIPTIYNTNETEQQTHKENYHLYFIEPKITIKKINDEKKEWMDVCFCSLLIFFFVRYTNADDDYHNDSTINRLMKNKFPNSTKKKNVSNCHPLP